MMQRYAMINESPKVLDKLASIAETTSGGFFKSEWFKESYRELQKTGRMFVEGEHSWRDDVAQPKFFKALVETSLTRVSSSSVKVKELPV